MNVVLDASAVLAVMLAEDGADFVSQNMTDAHVNAVNLSEVIAKLIQYGLSPEQTKMQINRIELQIHDFNFELAENTAILREKTKQFGLSLGDRACLALGQILDYPVLTSDRRMCEAASIISIDIRQIR